MMEYRLTAQRPADSNDPRGTSEFYGKNFSDMVAEAKGQGYPRIIDAAEREVTPWRRVTNYDFDEATP